jgi:hypothetical protein
MSLVKDFNELHIGLKTAVLTILCQMPFFFIASYLFKHDLITRISNYPIADMDFWFLICLSFCLSLTWFFMNVGLTSLLIALADRITKTDSEPHEVYIGSMIYSIGYLSLAIIISYKYSLTFNSFLVWAYLYICFRILWTLIWTYILRKHL